MTLISEILARRMRLPRPETRDVICERDLRVGMDDGAVLLADRWVARSAAGARQPTVLVRSPYGRRQLVGVLFGRLLAERGLQVVIQSVRGTFGSAGEFSPFDEHADGLATVRWLRTQPWHSGRIGTIGPSYLGFVQWAIAADAGADLAAMSIHVSASQFHGQTYAGRSVSLENVASWMVIIAAQERRFGLFAMGRALRGLPPLLAQLPLADLDERATGGAVTWYREAFASPRREDPYWTQRDFSKTVANITAPVQFVGGWYDILLPWMLEDFEALQAAGRGPQLLIGPWSHTAPQLAGTAEREGLAWLRAHLLGDDRLLRRSPVRLFVTGSGGGWRDLGTWPPPEVSERCLYLEEGRRLRDDPPSGGSGSGGSGSSGSGAGGAGGGDGYRYDPADPTPSLGGPVLLSRDPVVDNAPLEVRPDVLVYTGPVLTEPLEAIGHVRVELFLRASLPYFDVFARVCDVDGAGVSRNVCDALTSVDPDGQEQLPDGSWRVRFNLWPMGHRFAAGHRVRLQVSSGAHPRYARNPGTGADPATATADSLRAVDVEVLHDAEHPSALVLPVIPASR
ncbi:MAG TPA: CocE/NonD family hydrolase [Solirubrobacteraceae bacterium]|nr:CocE/NonD family hydrolase [Solirubrobacteraceae bacterium]